MARLKKCLVLAGAAVAAAALGAPATAFGDVLAPEAPHSPNASAMRDAYVVIGIIAAILGLVAIVALIAAVRRFRAPAEAPRVDERAARRVQPLVAAGLGVVATVIFILGVVFTEDARELEPTGAGGLAEANPLEINASGQQWLWRYQYPDELKTDTEGPTLFSYEELVVPVDTAVKLNLRSVDVQHRWSVPALAPMAAAVPGEVNETWFTADETGTYEGRSMEFSGPATAAMRTTVRVVEPAEFEAWIAGQEQEIAAAQQEVARAVTSGAAPGVSE